MCVIVYKFFRFCCLFFFKQKTAYEMRISDWSSDVCSSDLHGRAVARGAVAVHPALDLAVIVDAAAEHPHGLLLHGIEAGGVGQAAAADAVAGTEPDRKSVV